MIFLFSKTDSEGIHADYGFELGQIVRAAVRVGFFGRPSTRPDRLIGKGLQTPSPFGHKPSRDHRFWFSFKLISPFDREIQGETTS